MVNQSSVLVKLDAGMLESLDSLCSELGCKRNRLINFACKVLLDNMKCVPECRLSVVYFDAVSELYL